MSTLTKPHRCCPLALPFPSDIGSSSARLSAALFDAPLLADEHDAAQERGQVQHHGVIRPYDIPGGNIAPAVTEIGLMAKQVHEARIIRDAERSDRRTRVGGRALGAPLLNHTPLSAAAEIGRDLISVKQRIGHGNFLPWIEAEFGMSERSAQNFIAVAETFKSASVADLPPTVLYALAAPSTEPDVRTEVEAELAGSDVALQRARQARRPLAGGSYGQD